MLIYSVFHLGVVHQCFNGRRCDFAAYFLFSVMLQAFVSCKLYLVLESSCSASVSARPLIYSDRFRLNVLASMSCRALVQVNYILMPLTNEMQVLTSFIALVMCHCVTLSVVGW